MGGKGAGQMTLAACVEGYMSDLKFDQKKIARIYTAFRYQDQSVVMNPNFRFGEPIVEENGYPADVLWRGVISEGSFERAADSTTPPFLLSKPPIATVTASWEWLRDRHGSIGLRRLLQHAAAN